MENTPSSPRVPSPFPPARDLGNDSQVSPPAATPARNTPVPPNEPDVPPNEPEYLTRDYAEEVEQMFAQSVQEAPAETPTPTDPNHLTQTRPGYNTILFQPLQSADNAAAAQPAAQAPAQTYQERPAAVPPAGQARTWKQEVSRSEKIARYTALGVLAVGGVTAAVIGISSLSRGCDNTDGSNSGYDIGSGCNSITTHSLPDSGLEAAVSATDGDADSDSDVDSNADGTYEAGALPAPVSDGDSNGDADEEYNGDVTGDGDLDERVGDGDVSGDGSVLPTPAPGPVVTPTPTPAPSQDSCEQLSYSMFLVEAKRRIDIFNYGGNNSTINVDSNVSMTFNPSAVYGAHQEMVDCFRGYLINKYGSELNQNSLDDLTREYEIGLALLSLGQTLLVWDSENNTFFYCVGEGQRFRTSDEGRNLLRESLGHQTHVPGYARDREEHQRRSLERHGARVGTSEDERCMTLGNCPEATYEVRGE